MVDGVNFNPFAPRAFNAEEIEKCDTNKDGVISYEEMEANASWLSTVAGVDDEGEVQIGEDDSSSQANAPQAAETEPAVVLSDNELKIYGAAVSNGVQSSADNAEQLHENRRCNIRRYAQRRNRHTTQIAACQNIQQTHRPTGTHQDLNHRRIHERQGHTGQQPVYQQAQQCASHLLRQCQPLRYLDITHTKKLPSRSGILSALGQKTLIYEHIIS